MIAWLRRNLVPPPRRPPDLAAWLLLVLPPALLLAGAAAASLAERVTFTVPGAFLWTWTLPWLAWLHLAGFGGLPPWRARASVALRLGLAALAVLLLAEPRAVRRHEGLAVVFAIDVSASVGAKSVEEARAFLARAMAAKERPRDRVGFLSFGREAAVEMLPRESFPGDTALNAQVRRDGTDLAQALSLAAAVVPDEDQGRIVLVSDGVATAGDLESALDDLTARGLAVDVLPVDYDFADEVWLERLVLPPVVKRGESYEAAVILSSLAAGRGELVLEENGREIFRQVVDYRAGKNRYVVPIYLREAGYYEYTARIDPEGGRDGFARNNRAMGYLHLAGAGRVLVVVDPDGDARDHEPLVAALRQAQRAVEVQAAEDFPRAALPLLPYDAIVFVNVPRQAFDELQLAALQAAVRHQGTGFLMVGGPDSFGPGGYHRTVVEEILPVDMDIRQRKVLPKGALVIVLHTCEFPQGNAWGKEITKQAMKVLSARDEVGVLVYDYQGGVQWLFPLTPAGQYDELARKVAGAQIGDMPSFAPTMQMGHTALKASDAAVKHMIIISDGDPSPPAPEVLTGFQTDRISASTVAIFPHGNNDTAVMQQIAAITGGRYYYPQDPRRLPSIFIKEARTLQRSMIQNREFEPVARLDVSGILKGLGPPPRLRGFVLTQIKPRATLVLEGPADEAGEDPPPILATWRHGVGKTAAFTSDLSANWAARWLDWERFHPFCEQLITDIARVQEQSSLRLSTWAAGERGTVLIEDQAEGGELLELTAQVQGPGGEVQAIELEQVGPRRYEGSFALSGEGRYQVLALGVAGERQQRAHGGFVLPFAAEFLRFRSQPRVLEEIARRTGGRLLRGDEQGPELFAVPRASKARSRPVFDWLLLALVLLWPLDVGLRRVQLDAGVFKEWLGRRRSRAQDPTLGALRRKKQEWSGRLSETPVRPAAPTRPAVPPAGRPAPTAPPPAATAPAPDKTAPPPTTTGKLVEFKRKRKNPEGS